MTKHKKRIYHPYNISFKAMFGSFPQGTIDSIKADGIFKGFLFEKTYSREGEREMDGPYIAEADGIKLFEKTACDIEHDSKPPSPKNLPRFGGYVIDLTSITGLPGHLTLEYKLSPSMIFKPDYPDLGERDNWERLYRVRNKIRFRKEISVETGLDLGNALLYAPDDCSFERLLEGLHYYQEAVFTDPLLERVICVVVCCMIDAYCEGGKTMWVGEIGGRKN